jgi:predicted alpha/beta-fold hydrolase
LWWNCGVNYIFVTDVGSLFQTPRTYDAANFEDLSEVVKHVKSLNPGIPIAATGVSMGGYIIFCLQFYN